MDKSLEIVNILGNILKIKIIILSLTNRSVKTLINELIFKNWD